MLHCAGWSAFLPSVAATRNWHQCSCERDQPELFRVEGFENLRCRPAARLRMLHRHCTISCTTTPVRAVVLAFIAASTASTRLLASTRLRDRGRKMVTHIAPHDRRQAAYINRSH